MKNKTPNVKGNSSVTVYTSVNSVHMDHSAPASGARTIVSDNNTIIPTPKK